MSNLKNLMIAKNLLSKLPKEEIDHLGSYLYSIHGEEYTVLCVDAVHPCMIEEGDLQQHYTWYIPVNRAFEIEIGNLLAVEQTVGCGVAIVEAVSLPYKKNREQHQNDLHPYCKVLSVVDGELREGYSNGDSHFEE